MITFDQRAALDIARALATAGIPVFVAGADPAGSTGFALPRDWQHTRADPGVVDRWRPGMAIAAVCGHGLDVIDVDPRNGGDLAAINGALPTIYGVAATPSGGVHAFINSLGIRKKTDLRPGIDVQAGAPDGTGRGFVFLAPTVRVSKATGAPVAYTWPAPLDIERWLASRELDTTGAELAQMVRDAAAPGAAPLNVAGILTAGIAPGSQDVELSRLAWRLRSAGIPEDVAYKLWQEAVDASELSGDPWERTDFDRHWGSADAKITAATAQPAWLEAMAGEVADSVAGVVATATEPEPLAILGAIAMFTEARMAETVAIEVLAGRFLWCPGLGWLRWDTRRWVECSDKEVLELLRRYMLARLADAHRMLAADPENPAAKMLREGWAKQLTAAKLRAVRDLAAGTPHVLRAADLFDADPDLLNTPDGIVDLHTGELSGHDAARLITKMTRGSYRPGYTHPDWEQALTALPPAERVWLQARYGQAATGHPTPDDLIVVEQGGGENGKGVLGTDGVVLALGDYADVASPKLAQYHTAGRAEHSTEMADLRGKRLLIGEELQEDRQLNMTLIKRITGVGRIKARRIAKDNITFQATHSLFLTTNPIPGVAETDHGTWRRLALLRFPYTFQKRPQDVLRADDRLGDLDLKPRIKMNTTGQHDAIVTWVVEGARRWYAEGTSAILPTPKIEADTRAWRDGSDRILAYWGARLVPDRDAAIWVGDQLDTFNLWLAENGHRPWAKETFTPRFAQHTETTRYGVELSRPKRKVTLSRPPTGTAGSHMIISRAVPERPELWLGVRFRAVTDLYLDDQTNPPQPNDSRKKLPGGTEGTEVDTPLHEKELQLNLIKESVPSVPYADLTSDAPPKLSLPVVGSGEANAPYAVLLAVTTDTPDLESKPAIRAAEKAAVKAAERLERIAEAAGPLVELPAVVTRDGGVHPVTLAFADDLLATCHAELTVDVETTGFPIGHADYALRTIQLGAEHAAVVLDAAQDAHRRLAETHLALAAVLHAHSATADLVPLAVAGFIDIEHGWDRMHDTVIPAKLADPTSTGSDPGLKQLAGAVLGEAATSPAADEARAALFKAGKWLTNTIATTPIARSGWAQVDSRSTTMVRYAASDVLDDAALAARLPSVVPAVLARERLAQRMTARVAYHGLAIDGAHVSALLEQHTAERGRVAERLCQEFDIDNPGSNLQVAAALAQMGATLSTTPTGRPSVAEGVLEPLRRSEGRVGEFVTQILDYRHHDTVLGTFLAPYHQLVTRGDGRARPTVYTLGTDTGRMSCVRPNLQQLPREGGVRACITADPGQLLISADFAGVELRVAAALSGDRQLNAMLASGEDLHWTIAREVFGPAATKAERYTAKRVVFGRLYGGGIPALARQSGASQSVVASAVDVLDMLTPELSRWSQGMRDAVKNGHTQYPTYAGRVVYLPTEYPHKAPNYAIQGTARELLVDTLVRWADTEWGRCTLMPIHDELVVFVPEADAQRATEALKDAMTHELMGVAIAAEASEPSYEWRDAS